MFAIGYYYAVLTIAISKDALKALERLPADTAARIRAKIGRYARNPKALANNVKKLKGREGYRLRVGDQRVIFERDRDTMIVLAIGHRGAIYDE